MLMRSLTLPFEGATSAATIVSGLVLAKRLPSSWLCAPRKVGAVSPVFSGAIWVWVKKAHQGIAGFSLWFHFSTHFGYAFLTHSHALG